MDIIYLLRTEVEILLPKLNINQKKTLNFIICDILENYEVQDDSDISYEELNILDQMLNEFYVRI